MADDPRVEVGERQGDGAHEVLVTFGERRLYDQDFVKALTALTLGSADVVQVSWCTELRLGPGGVLQVSRVAG